MKNQQNVEFYLIYARKKIIFMIFARKMPEVYMIIARKNIFPDFFFGGGGGAPLPHVSYAYVCQ